MICGSIHTCYPLAACEVCGLKPSGLFITCQNTACTAMPEIPRIAPHNNRFSLCCTLTKTQGHKSVHHHDITEPSLTTETGSRGTHGERVHHGRRWSTRGEALQRPTRQSVPPELFVTSRSPASWRPHRTPASRHGMLHQINSSGTTSAVEGK